MYKWPQGRVIRVISFLLCVAIAADLGWNGSAKLYVFFTEGMDPGSAENAHKGFFDSAKWQQLAPGTIFALAALFALVGGAIAIFVKHSTVDFLIEVEQEMTRVTWPSINDLVRHTLFIAVMIAVLASAIFVVDTFNYKVVVENLFGGR